MLLYSLVIVISFIAIVGINILANPNSTEFYVYIIAGVIFLVALFIIDGLVALVIRHLPKDDFNLDNKFFIPSEREKKFFNKIKVNKWKDVIPELGGFTNFHKDKLANPYDNKYISRYIMEACYGIAIHEFSVPMSFLVMFIDYKAFVGESYLMFTMALPMAVINAILILLPAFVLKYNIPRLKIIYDFNLEREMRKEKGSD